MAGRRYLTIEIAAGYRMVESICLGTTDELAWVITPSIADENKADLRRLSESTESCWSAVSGRSPDKPKQAA